MSCKRCKRGKCGCKKPSVISTTPEVVKVNTIPVPGQPGVPGEAGDTYVPELTDNWFSI
jgi:hypothetical protein